MNIINPRDLKIVNQLPPVAKRGDKISIDSEFFGQTKSRLHRPHGTFAFLGCSFDGETVYYITDETQIQEFFNRLEAGVWIFHTAKYDITQLRRFSNIPDRELIYDTMLMEQIRFSGYYNSFGLKDLARRYLGIYMEKETRDEFSESNTVSTQMLDYSCVDVVATWRVYQVQKSQLDESEKKIWREIERPFLPVLLSMRGMLMDKQAWIALYERNFNDALTIQKKYMENPEILDEMSLEEAKKKRKFKGLNLGSTDQVGKEIIRRGYKLPKTPAGKPSTQEDDLTPYKDDEFVSDVLEYRGKMKAAGTYGKNWIDSGFIEDDNRVYSDFYQVGAATGRLSSSSPNVENIPVRETPDFRKCFVAGEGNVLIDADWSSQEPRIAAFLSQDEQLIQIFRANKDVYIESARLMFGWELDKKDPRRKERMKPTVLGASYGLTEYGMEKKYGIPKEEGKELLRTFFSTFHGMNRWKDEQHKKKNYVETPYGRKFWLNPYNGRQSENNALNSPVQGGAGDGIKLASVEFMKRVRKAGYQDSVWLINLIHDELLLECKKELKDWTIENLRDSMITVAESIHPGIPADVEIHSGYSWHEAHG